MIGLDTNVLVRYLVQDDPVQAALATEAITALTEAAPGWISSTVCAGSARRPSPMLSTS